MTIHARSAIATNWRHSVLYQVYPRSFSDSTGTGMGDLRGITEKVGYLAELGVDGVWLNPIMCSPGADHGYDVSDPRDVDPLFGDVAALRELADTLHAANMVLIMDLVPNHTSEMHPWFQQALASPEGSPERQRYHFRAGRGPDGDLPPNNWPSIFGGPAWTRTTTDDGQPGQWYLHLFAKEQPDLNWDNPEVAEDLERTLRFWLELGVDGFRIDVAHGLAKDPQLSDIPEGTSLPSLIMTDQDRRFDQPGVHEVHRRIRSVVNEYPGAVTFGEVWVGRPERFAQYLREDELHFAFDFHLTEAEFDATQIRSAIDDALRAVRGTPTAPTWALSNHDVKREVSRYGDGEVGEQRARAMALVLLALPGIAFVYYGEELGLPSVMDLPECALTDPIWDRSGHTKRGRDDCRIPMPWNGTEPPFGFSTESSTWLPIPKEWEPLTISAQQDDPESMLTLYRRALSIRRGWTDLHELNGDSTIIWHDAPSGGLIFSRTGGQICAVNTSEADMSLPEGELLLASAPLRSGLLPPNSAAWLQQLEQP